MFYENSKSCISVSDEVQELMKSYLIKKGVGRSEAEYLAFNYKSDFRQVVKHSSVVFDCNEMKESPVYDEIKSKFKKPSLLKKKQKDQSLGKGKSLSELYQMYKSIPESEEIKKIEKNEPKISNLEHQKIINLALGKKLSKENAEFIAATSIDINEAIATINSMTMYTLSIPGKSKKIKIGEVFLFTKGLNLTCADCTVCYENFEIGDELLSLYCFHTFHKECIDKWIKLSGGSKCPVCGQTHKDLLGLVN